VLAAGAGYCWHRWRQLARAEFIRTCTFSHGLFEKVRAKRPQLDNKQLQLVAHALRQFFLAYLRELAADGASGCGGDSGCGGGCGGGD
jgi:hypothetical protein